MEEKRKKSARTEQGIEACRNNHRRQHERDSGQCAQEGFAEEVKAGEEDGSGQSEDEGDESGEEGLIKRKT